MRRVRMRAAWRWPKFSGLRLALGRLSPPVGAAGPAQYSDPPGATLFSYIVVPICAALARASGWQWMAMQCDHSSVLRGSFCNKGQGFLMSYGLQLPSERLLQG